MRKSRAFLPLCVAIVSLLVPALLPASDTLLIRGHIYTGNAKAPWAQALAITGTRIDAVGSDQEIPARRQPKTQANAYTKGSALARFSEDRLGTLEPGKEAVLAVLSQDIVSIAHDEIAKTKVWMTMVGGKIVFQGSN